MQHAVPCRASSSLPGSPSLPTRAGAEASALPWWGLQTGRGLRSCRAAALAKSALCGVGWYSVCGLHQRLCRSSLLIPPPQLAEGPLWLQLHKHAEDGSQARLQVSHGQRIGVAAAAANQAPMVSAALTRHNTLHLAGLLQLQPATCGPESRQPPQPGPATAGAARASLQLPECCGEQPGVSTGSATILDHAVLQPCGGRFFRTSGIRCHPHLRTR